MMYCAKLMGLRLFSIKAKVALPLIVPAVADQQDTNTIVTLDYKSH
jgi:hypothetical protein